MLNLVKTMKGYKLRSLDGEIGTVNEFYFDDDNWYIRYLIANTGNWLTGRQVLISPQALSAVNKKEGYIAVNLSNKQIEDSPSLEQDKPVSRQFEEAYHGFFGWPYYWDGEYILGADPNSIQNRQAHREPDSSKKRRDTNLRSTLEVSGYNIEAKDGDIGHIEDFIIDDENWVIRYLVIDTRNWLPGKKVLIAPQWIDRISWGESKVFVKVIREIVKGSPEYNEDSLLSRDYEIALHQSHQRQGYWID